MSSRRWRVRAGKPQGGVEWGAAGIVALVVLSLAVRFLHAAYGTLIRDWYAAGLVVGAGAMAWGVRGGLRAAARRRAAARLATLTFAMAELDRLTPKEFELATRDLLIRDGMNARHVGQAGDQAADVIALDRSGRRVVVQCKHTAVGGRVGARVMYEVNGTAGPAHRADFAVVVTNGMFTKDARAFAERHKIGLVDRALLERWASRGESLGELLHLSAYGRYAQVPRWKLLVRRIENG